MTAKLTLFLGCVLFLFGCADRNVSDDARLAGGIIEGEPLSPTNALNEVSQQIVMLAFNYEYRDGEATFFGLCTAVVVNERTILTAAHCVESGIDKVAILTSTNPREQLRKKKDVYRAINYKIHDNYVPKKELEEQLKQLTSDLEKSRALTRNADLALIYLDRPLEIKSAAPNTPPTFALSNQPLRLPKTVNTDIIVTGYGKTSALNDTSKIKYEDLNGILKQAKLSIATSEFSRSGFFLEQWQAPGICNGDSGGPVFVKDFDGQYKVAALAINVYEINNAASRKLDPKDLYSTCAGHGLYLNLENYKSWIVKTAALLAQ